MLSLTITTNKTYLLKVILVLFVSFPLLAQQSNEIDAFIAKGIELHDQGKYQEAIKLYDKALDIEPQNKVALVEKALTLSSAKYYQESIELCKKIIKDYPDSPVAANAYVTYGNNLDLLNKPLEALKIYDQGIKQFPNSYQLHFNKAIALNGLNRYNEALKFLQTTAQLNPQHPGTQHALCGILMLQNKRIPALLANLRFLVLEPTTSRSMINLERLTNLMDFNIKVAPDGVISVPLDKRLVEPTKSKKKVQNDFHSVELTLNLEAALDFDEQNKGKSAIEKFTRKMESLFSSLNENKETNKGFYWDYYVPYFLELHKKNYIEPFIYTIFSSQNTPEIQDWLKSHQHEVEQFKDWSEKYFLLPNTKSNIN